MTTQLAYIVVNWNSREDLTVCLNSLSAELESGAPIEVWVVDNGSSDDSASMVRKGYPWVNLIESDKNLGFSAANNLAINASHTPYVCLINTDAYVHSGCTDALIAFASENANSAIVGPKVFNTDGTVQMSCRRFPTLGAGFFRNTLLGRLFPNNKFAASYLMEDFTHDRVCDVDWISGCAMLIRRDAIDSIGALDERFFMYCEDVDICKRVWDSGRSVTYCPEALVTHAIGRSSDKNAEAMIIEFHRSWLTYDVKHNPKSNLVRRALIAAGLWLRAAVRIFNRRRALRRMRTTGDNLN